MKEKMKRIEEYTKAMRELLAKMLEEDPDSSSNIYKEIWGAYTAGDITFDALQIQQLIKALYWILDELKNDHQGIGFGELIDCLLCILATL